MRLNPCVKLFGVASDKPVDFDAILQALGAADAEPPPLMKLLLGDLPPAPADSTGLSPVDTAIIAQLDAWLEVLRDETAAS